LMQQETILLMRLKVSILPWKELSKKSWVGS